MISAKKYIKIIAKSEKTYKYNNILGKNYKKNIQIFRKNLKRGGRKKGGGYNFMYKIIEKDFKDKTLERIKQVIKITQKIATESNITDKSEKLKIGLVYIKLRLLKLLLKKNKKCL
jgi:protoporphyrinogen oxidase